MLKILFLLIGFIITVFANNLYAQKRVGNLTLESVKPQAANGQEIVYKDENKQEVKVEYGTLVVPERHDKPNGNTIELAFFRLKSPSPNPSSPIVYLEGGPGLPGTNAYYAPIMELLIPLREIADVIILDQRGTGHTKPSMICRDVPSLFSDKVATYETLLNDSRERNRRCAEFLRSQGIDLSAYNMNESADDLEDLRKALGAKKISLLGFSGGTTLALATLRRHGGNLDRVVMAAVEGTAHMNKLPSNLQKQLVQIDRLVKADPKISKLVPDLLGLMKTVLDKFEKEPMTVELIDPNTKQKSKVKVGKYVLQAVTSLMIGTTEDIKLLPIFYYTLSKRDTTLLAEVLSQQNKRSVNATAFLMDCSSGVSKQRQEQIRREANETLLGDAFNFPFPEGCDVWGNPDLGDAYRSDIMSAVPTLLISGTLDGFTPVSNAQEFEKGLSNSVHLIIEGGGHEDLLIGTEKAKEVIKEFMKGLPASTKSISFPPIKFKMSK
ncbi:MAG: alpha/beta fold hydrolase [Acidobacteriota bacterium]